MEHTIPWGFVLPEAESGVRLRPPLESEDITDDLLDRIPRSERTAVMEGAPTRPTSSLPPPARPYSSFMPPSSLMSSMPPPPMPSRPMSSAPPPPFVSAALVAQSAPPPPMHPSILPAVQALMVATACGWIVPPSAARAGEVRSSHAPLGWRLYVLFTTAMMAALATSVLFLTGHASAMTKTPASVAPPVITVNVPPPPSAPPAVTTAAPIATAPPPRATAHFVAPRAPSAPPPKPTAVVSAAPPPAPPPPTTAAQETADMLREQLGAAVH